MSKISFSAVDFTWGPLRHLLGSQGSFLRAIWPPKLPPEDAFETPRASQGHRNRSQKRFSKNCRNQIATNRPPFHQRGPAECAERLKSAAPCLQCRVRERVGPYCRIRRTLSLLQRPRIPPGSPGTSPKHQGRINSPFAVSPVLPLQVPFFCPNAGRKKNVKKT